MKTLRGKETMKASLESELSPS